jgi:predicted membrane protein
MSWRILFGLVLLVIGIGSFLEQLHLVPPGSVRGVIFQWWPCVFVLLGVNQIVRRAEQPWTSLILVGLGIALLSLSLGRHPLSVTLYAYTILLILIALSLLLPNRNKRGDTAERKGKSLLKHHLQELIFASGVHYQVFSQQFDGGRIWVVFGDYLLDLTEMGLSPQGGDLTMLAIFGNITVRIPAHIDFTFSGVPVLGALENSTQQIVGHEPGRPQLQMRGTTICGNIAISN